jgi:hypothetical protein
MRRIFAPRGEHPGQRGFLRRPEGVSLVYATGEEIEVAVEWAGWDGDTRIQVWRTVNPERDDLPVSVRVRVWPGLTALQFPMATPGYDDKEESDGGE